MTLNEFWFTKKRLNKRILKLQFAIQIFRTEVYPKQKQERKKSKYIKGNQELE